MTLQGNFTFRELLAQLKYNVSRTRINSISAITQIRKVVDVVKIAVTYKAVSWGPNYYVYPGWNTEDVESWWPLKDPITGTNGVVDIYGSSPGTINGGPAAGEEFVPSLYTYGRKLWYTTFDGIGDYINVGDITSFDGATQLSIAAHVKVTDLSVNRIIISRWTSADGNKQFALLIFANGNIQWTEATNAVGDFAFERTNTTPIAVDTEYDILVSKNGATIVIYVNGVAQSSDTGSTPGSLEIVTADVLIGKIENDASTDFKGNISNVVYWTDTLSAAEALAHATDGLSDRMVAGMFRLPGDYVVELPEGKQIMPTRVRGKRGLHSVAVAHRIEDFF